MPHMEENKQEGIVPETIINKKEESSIKISTPVAILIAGVIIGGAVIYTHSVPSKANLPTNGIVDTQQGAGQQPPAPAVDIKDVVVSGEPYIGDVNAPVTIAYWSDWQCPFCKQFEENVLTSLVENYVKAGKLKVVFKDFQFLGPDSTTAALHARAIWELYPSQYFAWRTAMFNAQDTENGGFGDQASVAKLTSSISGIDEAKVTALIAQKKDQFQKAIDADRSEGSSMGVQGTPAIIAGTQLIPGALPYASFSQLIDGELNK